jgi:hypothetical protein
VLDATASAVATVGVAGLATAGVAGVLAHDHRGPSSSKLTSASRRDGVFQGFLRKDVMEAED